MLEPPSDPAVISEVQDSNVVSKIRSIKQRHDIFCQAADVIKNTKAVLVCKGKRGRRYGSRVPNQCELTITLGSFHRSMRPAQTERQLMVCAGISHSVSSIGTLYNKNIQPYSSFCRSNSRLILR